MGRFSLVVLTIVTVWVGEGTALSSGKAFAQSASALTTNASGLSVPSRDGAWISPEAGLPAEKGGSVDNGGERVILSASGGALADKFAQDARRETAAGLTPGENIGGVVDRVFVMAPPNWSYTLETRAGSFVDCGDETTPAKTDDDGRDSISLSCGVTISETLVIPAAARSAILVIHH